MPIQVQNRKYEVFVNFNDDVHKGREFLPGVIFAELRNSREEDSRGNAAGPLFTGQVEDAEIQIKSPDP